MKRLLATAVSRRGGGPSPPATAPTSTVRDPPRWSRCCRIGPFRRSRRGAEHGKAEHRGNRESNVALSGSSDARRCAPKHGPARRVERAPRMHTVLLASGRSAEGRARECADEDRAFVSAPRSSRRRAESVQAEARRRGEVHAEAGDAREEPSLSASPRLRVNPYHTGGVSPTSDVPAHRRAVVPARNPPTNRTIPKATA